MNDVVGVIDDEGGHADRREDRPHVLPGRERQHACEGRWAIR